MNNPLANLSPALAVLANNVDVIPASGRAMEDLVRPDEDEEIDRKLTEDLHVVDTVWETPNRDWYRSAPPISRTQRHLFRYFLDGSRRSYFLGTAIEGERATPIQLSQVGAAIVHRNDDGKIYGHASENKLLLLLSKNQLSDEVWKQLECAVVNVPDLELGDISSDDQLNRGSVGIDLRSRGGGKTNWAMHQMEVDLANKIRDRKEDEWLIADGSLQFEPPITAPRTLGIAKSFNKELLFEVSAYGHREKKSLFHVLMDLKPEHRTAVWAARDGKIAFWYVRLRAQGKLDYPLMGVVKVEYRPPNGEVLDSELY